MRTTRQDVPATPGDIRTLLQRIERGTGHTPVHIFTQTESATFRGVTVALLLVSLVLVAWSMLSVERAQADIRDLRSQNDQLVKQMGTVSAQIAGLRAVFAQELASRANGSSDFPQEGDER